MSFSWSGNHESVEVSAEGILKLLEGLDSGISFLDFVRDLLIRFNYGSQAGKLVQSSDVVSTPPTRSNYADPLRHGTHHLACPQPLTEASPFNIESPL